MSQELLAIIEQLEREKGIKKEVLIDAVQSALVSAARKVIDGEQEEDIKVEIDQKTGKIRAFRSGKEIDSIDFGRIAASTARQVIIQKIREAEKDVIFNEFTGKVGEIVSGTVYRFDKGNIIVDLLGKAEGILPKREQSTREEFKQGQRIRAYVVEVKKDTKGPQIILSRAHPNMVKKFFELEVPEIFDGIVEIKAIARQAGERTKISVCSKNDKVDSVGACVGMRGNRVRNIVTELGGEKIDIVRYNDDMREYIKAALSPAKISEIKLDKENNKAHVVVDDDQLSLAIGKHGQNVRLASKLIGWDLDIRSKSDIAGPGGAVPKEQEAKAAAEEMFRRPEEISAIEETTAAEGGRLEELPGVGEKLISYLREAGFNTLKDVAGASTDGLLKVKGIGEKKAEKLINDARDLLEG